MISQILKGISHVRIGFKLIKLRGVKRYVAIPALINIILFSAAIWYGYLKFDSLLGAPFNGFLSEKIEERIEDATTETTPKLKSEADSKINYLELLRGARIGISNEFRKLFYIAIRAIPLVFIWLIPGINVFAPAIWFLFGSWLLAIEYLDYPMGNRDYTFKQQLDLIKQHRFLCLGMGIGLMVMTIIPVLNFFAMPVGVAAATSLWTEHLKTNPLNLENQKH